ncbi:uncharacterized protein UTRI_06449 [Ustilago trichophora]|uniref:Uncharacterized protein n=1 Tax=Ustilago trichophora TaxID=86804 RepID=A0A5C3EMN4_9BASI|nr:uncharacterized protein UTRI_06449 [Ustilago trichophora]
MPAENIPVWDSSDYTTAVQAAMERGIPDGIAPGTQVKWQQGEARLRSYGQKWLDHTRRNNNTLPETWEAFTASDAEVDQWFWPTAVEVVCSDGSGPTRSSEGALSELEDLWAAWNRIKPPAKVKEAVRKSCMMLVNEHPQTRPPKEKEYSTWEDIEQLIKLGVVDFRIRNLKSHRHDLTKSKTIPIVSDPTLASITDPVLLLAWMAIQDGAFKQVTSLEELENPDLSWLGSRQKTWKIRMRADVAEQPIFRRFSKQQGLGYTAEATQAWTIGDFHNRIESFREQAGLPTFSTTDTRRLCAASFNDPFITQADALHAFGHRPGSRVMVDNYLLDRIEINVLALIRGHKQRVNLISGQGITKKKFVPLSRADEIHLVDADKEVRDLMDKCNNLQTRLKEETGSSGKRSRQEDQLYDSYVAATCELQAARNRVRKRIQAKHSKQDGREMERQIFRHHNLEHSEGAEASTSRARSPWTQESEPSHDQKALERLSRLQELYTACRNCLQQHFDVPIRLEELFQCGARRIGLKRLNELLSTGNGTLTPKWMAYVLKHFANFHSPSEAHGQKCGCTFKKEGSLLAQTCKFSVPDASDASVAMLACH